MAFLPNPWPAAYTLRGKGLGRDSDKWKYVSRESWARRSEPRTYLRRVRRVSDGVMFKIRPKE